MNDNLLERTARRQGKAQNEVNRLKANCFKKKLVMHSVKLNFICVTSFNIRQSSFT